MQPTTNGFVICVIGPVGMTLQSRWCHWHCGVFVLQPHLGSQTFDLCQRNCLLRDSNPQLRWTKAGAIPLAHPTSTYDSRIQDVEGVNLWQPPLQPRRIKLHTWFGMQIVTDVILFNVIEAIFKFPSQSIDISLQRWFFFVPLRSSRNVHFNPFGR